ncbi:MAG: formylglycine-generating enzyme family protein [Kiritimatiellae bacterium]|nr:formylglycine-generating enzyme family protein [Kiritimatiellia bacterium]
MTNAKLTVAVFHVICALALVAAPIVRESSVTFTQRKYSSYVMIDYVLDGDPAVITVDIQTNGVSIGTENFRSLSGDVGCVVKPGVRTIKWAARNDWPDRRLDDGSIKAVVTAWATNNPPPYMVLSVDGVTPPVWYVSTNAIPGWGLNSNRLYKTDKIVMRKIPAANVRWRMGSPYNEPSRIAEREIPHWVTLTSDYYMGIYPCTRKQYELITGYTGTATFKDYEDYDFRPVGKVPYSIVRGSRSNNIDWPTTGTNVASGSTIYNIRRKALLDTIDLPTDAQWEYACRAGEGAGLYNGKEQLRTTINDGIAPTLDDIAWYGGKVANSVRDGQMQTFEVGLKQPNAYGLYDMLGNVYEWCLDWYSEGTEHSDGSSVTDPPGASANALNRRVCRGGSYGTAPTESRSAARTQASDENAWDDVYGFRFCCPAIAK